jgi:asparagine synthase (glutamine-hydrolysing)
MCGLAGIVFGDPETARRMPACLALLHHRGPDGQGMFRDRDATLGHARLRILDTSEAGDQPMISRRGAALIYNGEVYNYRELLRDLGGDFQPQSQADTDVVLALLERDGPAALERMNGMWALALWQPGPRKLLLARDRFGIKPLYYAILPGGGVAFASEIPALLALAGIPPRPDYDTVREFLLYAHAEPRERSFFAGVHKLPPGCYAEVTPTGLRVQEFFRLDDAIAAQAEPERPVERYADLLRDAIKLRLRSDVPVGTCLSGGLDSSSIVCTVHRAARAGEAPPTLTYHAFSARHPGTSADEGHFIADVLAQTAFHGHDVVPSPERLQEEILNLVRHQGEPFGSLAVYAQWCVMRLAREHGVTVLLDGQGADEVLAGYPLYAHYRLGDLLRSARLAEAAALARDLARVQGQPIAATVRAVAGALLPQPAKQQLRRRAGPPGAGRFLSPELRGANGHPPELPGRYRDRFTDALYMTTTDQGLPSLLRYEDRNSMAFSVEARVPFLDYRLVTLGFRLAPEWKLKDGWTKWILRQAMADDLPGSIRWRRDKKAFSTPQAEWLRGPLREWVRDLLASRSLRERGLYDASQLSREYEAWLGGGRAIDPELWLVLSTELWMRELCP